jgi:hypothetical protein
MRKSEIPTGIKTMSGKEHGKLFPSSRPTTQVKIERICPRCNNSKWVSLPSFTLGQLCKECNINSVKPINQNNSNSPVWKDDLRKLNTQGYILTRVAPDSPFISMAKKNGRIKNLVLEHRLVMAKHLQRCLAPTEIIHHKNGIKSDNRLSNLELISSNSLHVLRHHVHVTTSVYIAKLEDEIKNLNKRIKLLEKEV